METLNLSPSAPRSENRLKTLFWPSIENEIDIDTVTRQGFWLCVFVGLVSFAAGPLQGQLIGGIVEGLFFLLAGVGVRRRSIAAAIGAFIVYSATTVLLLKTGQFSVLRIFMMALLLANVRGTWISAKLRPISTEPPPVPLESTLSERISDRWPIAIWPWGRWIFYVLLPLMLLGALLVVVAPTQALTGE